MNRQIQISKFIKSNRRKRGVRPTRWGTNNGACGDVNDGSSDSSNRTDHLEVDMQKQMKYIKRARLERRK